MTDHLTAISAKAVYVYDMFSKEVLMERNADAPFLIGSIVKLASACLALESGDLQKKVVVPERLIPEFQRLEAENAWVAALHIGDTLTRMQLLEMMVVNSACDAASILADDVSNGDMNGFVRALNSLAKRIGMTTTTFSSPHGVYEDAGHLPLSTARDVAKLTERAMSEPILRELLRKDHCVQPLTGEVLYNTNRMLRHDSPYYRDYVIGGKTGSTDAAGQCITIQCKRRERAIAAVVLGSPYKVGQLQPPQIYGELCAYLDKEFGAEKE